MRRLLILSGVVVVSIGLGLVFPQVANLRDSGALMTGQVLLLGLGLAVTAAGVASVIAGGRGLRRTG